MIESSRDTGGKKERKKDGKEDNGNDGVKEVFLRNDESELPLQSLSTISANAQGTSKDTEAKRPVGSVAQNEGELGDEAGNGNSRAVPADVNSTSGHHQDSSMKAALEGKDHEKPTPQAEGSQCSGEGTQDTFRYQDDLLVLNRFTLYETKTRFYAVASNQSDTGYRILKIDRTCVDDLILIEDPVTYDSRQLAEMLSMIDQGNKSSGGLKRTIDSYGIVGFIKFTGPYYICLITKRAVVALIGWNYIYHVDETALIPINASFIGRSDRSEDEQRYVTTFQSVDLCKNFYFSYTWDLTNTLQKNMLRDPSQRHLLPNDMFIWNHHLIREIQVSHRSKDGETTSVKLGSGWIIPLIHGYVDQAKLSILGRTVYLTLIGRRSRHFAGARFLKRGVNDRGYVANDVETEQIVAEMLTTPLRPFESTPGDKSGRRDEQLAADCENDTKNARRARRWPLNPSFTSYVQHRGSIPLFWSQDTTSMSPKPPIELTVVDPFYSAAALHFDNMFQRYGSPVIILNLVKAKEKQARESKLLVEYTSCIDYLNQSLPEKHRLRYIAWDMSRAAKSHDEDVIGVLEDIARECLKVTKFFHSGRNEMDNGEEAPLQQDGVVRTNCIDCLDRTNAAQFIIAKCALAHQLHALGVLDEPSLAFDTDAVNILTEMTHDLGDTIALQYGGSHLVNTMETYRKIGAWTSHSRDMIENLRRYYSNSFIDAEKQDAINLFLGNYLIDKKNPKLWELTSDFYLHNIDPRLERMHRDYIQWYTEDHLSKDPIQVSGLWRPRKKIFRDRYWSEYYRPLLLTSFARHFAFTMNSTLKYQSAKHDQDVSPLSPFYAKKSIDTKEATAESDQKLWLSTAGDAHCRKTQAEKEDSKDHPPNPKARHDASIDVSQRILPPNVTNAETEEYHRYIDQFSDPVLVSSASGEIEASLISDLDLKHFEFQSGLHQGTVLPHVGLTDTGLYEQVSTFESLSKLSVPDGLDKASASHRRPPEAAKTIGASSSSSELQGAISTIGPDVEIVEPRSSSSGQNVLFLRSMDTENQDYYHSTFERAGYCPCSIPVLTHVFCNVDNLEDLLGQPERYSGLILTSGRAIEAIQSLLKKSRRNVHQKWSTMPIYVVGASSRSKALDITFGSQQPLVLGHESGSSEKLAQYILTYHKSPKPLLYLVGDKRRDTISKAFKEASFRFEEIQVYETIPSPHFPSDLDSYLDLLGLEQDLHWAIFFSPSGVDVALPYLRTLRQGDRPFRIAAIGPTTADHLRNRYGIEVDATALKPDPHHLLKSVQNVL